MTPYIASVANPSKSTDKDFSNCNKDISVVVMTTSAAVKTRRYFCENDTVSSVRLRMEFIATMGRRDASNVFADHETFGAVS